MSEYRYVVFPYGKQPTLAEVSELRNYANLLAGQYAVGTCCKTRGLVIAFEAGAYEFGMLTNRGFESLLEKWQVRGAEITDHLSFVKDANALKPIQSGIWEITVSDVLEGSTPIGQTVRAKRLAAKEAVGRSMLNVQRTIQRYTIFKRLSKFLPYALVALAAIVIIIVGVTARNTLKETGAERRRDTTVRVLNDPMNQPLERQPISPE